MKKKATSGKTTAALKITVCCTEEVGAVSGGLRLPLMKAARMLGVSTGQWDITLVNDAAMSELHDRTMRISSTTDVLTFDLGEAVRGIEKRKKIELDTVICVDEARRRAEDLKHPLKHELLLYAVHSLLHVVGYDDVTSAKYKAMHLREDQVLTAIGVGPVFESDDRGSRVKRSRGRK